MHFRLGAISVALSFVLAGTVASAQVTATGGFRPAAPAAQAEAAPASQPAEGLTVDQIVALSEMQLGDEAIVAKIQASDASFDLSTDQMIALKQRGLSNAVIAAMVRSGVADTASEMSMDSPDPRVPHPAGVYLMQNRGGQDRMFRIDATSSSQMKTGGILGYALTSGIAPMSMKVSIHGANARAKAGSNPVFYFFFDQAQQGAVGGSFLGNTYLASSPAEFNLVELVGKKDRREAKIGKVGLGGAKVGIMDDDQITFDYQIVRAGVYKVTVNQALKPGEYGFLYSLGTGQGGAATARIFDFSVQ